MYFYFVKSAIEIAVHFAILGGLANLSMLLHQGQLVHGIIQTLVICACILLFAGVFYIAKKLIDKE